jgi:penicillin-binding protein 1A
VFILGKIKEYFKNFNPFRFAVCLAIVYFIIFCTMVVYIYSTVSSQLPSMKQLENPKQNQATQILSADGKILDHFFIQRRVNLPIDSFPKDFINALIATEDQEFYNHWGVNAYRILGASMKNLFSMHVRQGASTITMQLARNLYFTQEGTLKRKFSEIVTALQIEKAFTKKEILEMYTNTVNFGRGAFGLQVASEVYFDKYPMQLTTAECAFLVGILKAPERYNGLVDYEKAIQRRNLVLALMKNEGYLSEAKYNNSIKEPINLAKFKNKQKNYLIAPHFVEMIRQNLSKEFSNKSIDLYRDGLVINTTLDTRIQKYAEEAVTEHLNKYQTIFNKSFSWSSHSDLLKELLKNAVKNNPEYFAAPDNKKKQIEQKLLDDREFVDSVKNAATTVQIGLVVIDPATGAILAMVGASPKFMGESPDAKYSLNHVSQIRRQPGSSFKPFVYSCALIEGLTPQSQIECGPYTYTLPSGETWSPRGTGKCSEKGTYSLLTGLSSSVNTMAARLITQVTTPAKVIDLAHRMGIESQLHAVPALGLGAGGEVSPLEMTSAFGTFINEGVHVKPYFVESIEDPLGNVLFEKKKSEVSDALEPKIAREMCNMMQGVIKYGTAYTIRGMLGDIDAGGKTGTTNDYADAWFVGFTPQLVAGVWVGFDDRRITFTGGYGYAAQAAAPVWGMLMKKIYGNPKLPYRQKHFSFNEIYSLDSLASIEKDDDVYSKPPELDNSVPNNNEKPLPEKKDEKNKKVKFPDLNAVSRTDNDKKKVK